MAQPEAPVDETAAADAAEAEAAAAQQTPAPENLDDSGDAGDIAEAENALLQAQENGGAGGGATAGAQVRQDDEAAYGDATGKSGEEEAVAEGEGEDEEEEEYASVYEGA